MDEGGVYPQNMGDGNARTKTLNLDPVEIFFMKSIRECMTDPP